MIKVGDKVPNATFKRVTADGIVDVDLHALINGKKVVLFALPAAFSSTCSEQHLPSYVKMAEAIKAKGVDEIICVSVNDPIVMRAWEEASAVDNKISMLADWNADFSTAMGLTFDGSAIGLGTRSVRYTSIIDDGIIKHLDVEPNSLACTVSKADSVLNYL